MKRLTRSRKNRVIAGVCGGIGEYFNIDPIIIRLIWLVSIMVGGAGFIAYLIAWVIIPDDKTKVSLFEEWAAEAEGKKVKSKAKKHEMDNPEVMIGLFLIFIGLMFLFNNLGLFVWSWVYTWPSIFILIGVIIILSRRHK